MEGDHALDAGTPATLEDEPGTIVMKQQSSSQYSEPIVMAMHGSSSDEDVHAPDECHHRFGHRLSVMFEHNDLINNNLTALAKAIREGPLRPAQRKEEHTIDTRHQLMEVKLQFMEKTNRGLRERLAQYEEVNVEEDDALSPSRGVADEFAPLEERERNERLKEENNSLRQELGKCRLIVDELMAEIERLVDESTGVDSAVGQGNVIESANDLKLGQMADDLDGIANGADARPRNAVAQMNGNSANRGAIVELKGAIGSFFAGIGIGSQGEVIPEAPSAQPPESTAREIRSQRRARTRNNARHDRGFIIERTQA